jgi:chorismate mutase
MSQDPILAALKQQVDCYHDLAKLAAAQHELVQNSRTEDLLTLLAKRQEVLDSVGELEQCISPAKKRWAEFLDELDPQDRAQAEKLMAQTRKLLEEITTADRLDALVLQQRKLNLGREINQASAARQFNRNYASAAYRRKTTAIDVQR